MAYNASGSGLARLLRQQVALATFGSYAFREPVLQNILTEAARVCADGLGVPFCKVCRYRDEEDDLLVDAGFGWKSGVVGMVVSRADTTSPQGRAYTTGVPVIIDDLAVAKDILLPAFYGEHGIVSTINVIIKGVDGAPYGVLEIDSPVQHTYDEHDVIFLTGFANVLAEAVATATRGETLRRTLAEVQALVIEKDKLLSQRTVMAEELKHRVRNNLHLVHGVLASHQRNQTDKSERSSVSAIIRRVITLSEVYELLLGTELTRMVDLGDYLRALCASLPTLQDENNRRSIFLVCDACSMEIDLDTVTAVGMAVAELVSNSYEHASPNLTGVVRVTLTKSADADTAILVVSDNGTGFAEITDSKRHGVVLVRRLMEQVRGTADLTSANGAVWTLRFPFSAQKNAAT